MNKLIPSCGFFGGSQDICLNISCSIDIKAIKIKASFYPEAGFLNLGSVNFYDMGGQLISLNDGVKYKVKSSTIYNYNKNNLRHAYGLISNRGFHSAKEIEPYWSIFFEDKIHISRIEILNRPDRWGERSKNLIIEVQTISSNDNWITIYNNLHHESIKSLRFLEDIYNYFSISQKEMKSKFSLFDTVVSSKNNRNFNIFNHEEVLFAICVYLKEKSFEDLLNFNFKPALSFLSTWSNDYDFLDSERAIVATYLLARAVKTVNNYTSLSIFSRKLKCKKSLLLLQDEINKISMLYNQGSWFINRHGIQKNRMVENLRSFLNAINEIMNFMRSKGMEVFLLYGTLLGAIRDNGFIRHDDDVDLAYIIDADNYDEALLKVSKLGKVLEDAGYELVRISDSLNMHIVFNEVVFIDLFPVWVSGDSANLHMESMKIRSISKNMILPLKEMMFYDIIVFIPNKPEEFLFERYGGDWDNSDQFFEWQWSLIE